MGEKQVLLLALKIQLLQGREGVQGSYLEGVLLITLTGGQSETVIKLLWNDALGVGKHTQQGTSLCISLYV